MFIFLVITCIGDNTLVVQAIKCTTLMCKSTQGYMFLSFPCLRINFYNPAIMFRRIIVKIIPSMVSFFIDRLIILVVFDFAKMMVVVLLTGKEGVPWRYTSRAIRICTYCNFAASDRLITRKPISRFPR